MQPVARIGDQISHGGSITGGSSKVKANGVGVARVGDPVYCNIHGPQTIVSGSSKVKADGQAVARVGDSISCGAIIVSGSNNVFAD